MLSTVSRKQQQDLNGDAKTNNMTEIISPYAWVGMKMKPNIKHSAEITIQRVLSAVCDYYNIKDEDLKAKTRKRSIREPRQIATFLIRKTNEKVTMKRIGEVFLQDHTTVIHNITAVQNQIDTDAEFKATVYQIESHI